MAILYIFFLFLLFFCLLSSIPLCIDIYLILRICSNSLRIYFFLCFIILLFLQRRNLNVVFGKILLFWCYWKNIFGLFFFLWLVSIEIKFRKHITKSCCHLFLHLILQSCQFFRIQLSNYISISLNIITISANFISITFNCIMLTIYSILYSYPCIILSSDEVVSSSTLIIITVIIYYRL